MTTAKVVLCQNQGGLGYLGLLFPPGIFKRPNVCKLGGTNVNTNFHLGEDGLSLCDRLWEAGWGVFTASEASTGLLLGSAPRQWIVLSQPAVLSRNKSPPSTKEMRNGRAFLEKIPPPPTTPPYSKPLCAAWGAALLCLAAWRQQPSEEALRGAKGAKGGRLTGGGGGGGGGRQL